MSPAKNKRTSWIGWLLSAILIVGSVGLWTHRQYVVDAIHYHQFVPTDAVKEVANTAGLTKNAEFTFYATRPAIESSEAFNQHCQRREADSPILGCYSSNRIFLFDVTDERLNGLKAVTAAHELLHAEWERMPTSQKEHLQTLLEQSYKPGQNEKLDARMKYYEKAEPGQSINELHSIVGTEFESLSPELESYYNKYFADRSALVALHQQVENTFDNLAQEADNIVAEIENLAQTINTDTKVYNSSILELNASIESFNQRAGSQNGFTTQSEFQNSRQQLLNQSSQLSNFRQSIQKNIAEYKMLLAKLDTLNTESESLNASLDSTLSDAPKI